MAIRAGLASHALPTTIHFHTPVSSFVRGPVCTDTHTHTRVNARRWTGQQVGSRWIRFDPFQRVSFPRPVRGNFLHVSRVNFLPEGGRTPEGIPRTFFSSWEPRGKCDEEGRWKDGPMIEFPSLEVEWWMQSKVEFRGLFPLHVISILVRVNCILRECSLSLTCAFHVARNSSYFLSLKHESFDFCKLYYWRILIQVRLTVTRLPKLIYNRTTCESSPNEVERTFRVLSSSHWIVALFTLFTRYQSPN